MSLTEFLKLLNKLETDSPFWAFGADVYPVYAQVSSQRSSLPSTIVQVEIDPVV